jgi:hypothetical protein
VERDARIDRENAPHRFADDQLIIDQEHDGLVGDAHDGTPDPGPRGRIELSAITIAPCRIQAVSPGFVRGAFRSIT